MTFTESDAANDGLIKREVGREMAKVAKTHNPEMFEHFKRTCEEVGREPSEVFGEMCVRALNSEQYANEIFNSEVSMGQIKADEIRLDDVKYVKQLSEELGLNKEEESSDPIDKLINQRLEMVTQSPLDNLRKNRENPEGVNGEVLSHMENLQNEIARLESKIEGGEEEHSVENEQDNRGNKSVDDLFGDSSGTEEEAEQGDYGEEEVTVTEEEGGVETEVEPEPEPEDEPSQDEIDEALEGTGGSVDDIWEDDETEQLDPQMDIPGEAEEEDKMITSEDGEEE